MGKNEVKSQVLWKRSDGGLHSRGSSGDGGKGADVTDHWEKNMFEDLCTGMEGENEPEAISIAAPG